MPHRRKEGYGLHAHYVEELAQQKVKVLITVDLGISCVAEVEQAQNLGMDVILTDHHSTPLQLPKAFAILHPHVEKNYPFKELSGSGVAFKLASALLTKTHNEDWIPYLTDLASLGTVADCVPLVGENRTLVKLGLEQMINTRWEGLRALLMNAGAWEKQKFTTHTIGFQIGPRLNAAGRMDDPRWTLQTLLAEGLEAHQKATKLEGFNKQRQDLMLSMQAEAEAVLDLNAPLLMAAGKGWSSGLVGLIAGRLQEKYGKPAFILEDQGETLTGSARSLPGFHAVEALKQAEAFLEKLGGHELAAGFHLKKENYPAFVQHLQNHAAEQFQNTPLQAELKLDLKLEDSDLTLESIEKIQSFAPFGVGNPEPLFLLTDFELRDLSPLKEGSPHLKFTLKKGKECFEGIAFHRAGESEILSQSKEWAVHLEEREWRGQKSLQIRLVEAR
ncbi:hypothetical protein IPG41_06310 [Candidatus Peregrinibacteria bacterium]|nr:MAG: hypothetical protein IPG41_06310 [Candidatus Peregrinibacteria bacterium]